MDLPPSPAAEQTAMVEVVNYDRPKVIDWEDLQQELARLMSLSSELARAREHKESLSQRIESTIEAEKEPLQWQNELGEIRQKLDAKKLVMGDLLLRSRTTTEYVRTFREELSYNIRKLLASSETLTAARQKLQESKALLAGETGHGRLKYLMRRLRTRQQYMVTQVAMLYPLKDSGSQIVEGNPETDPINRKPGEWAEAVRTNASKSSQISPLSILGLQPVTPLKRMSLFGDKKEAQKSATALGYVAHAVLLLASYLDAPLRYLPRLGASHSYIQDIAPFVESLTSDSASSPIIGTLSKPTEFPLFLEGQDTTRAAYAIFLLNKDLEQLLNYVGGESVGPRHVLANLKELIRIVRSPEYIHE